MSLKESCCFFSASCINTAALQLDFVPHIVLTAKMCSVGTAPNEIKYAAQH